MNDAASLDYTPAGDVELYQRLAEEARQLTKTDKRHARYWREMEEKAKKMAGKDA